LPSHFVLTLDTRAPVLTWGAATGTTAGELLQVGYSLDEPALVSASIRFADGRTFALGDTGLTLEVLLPPDVPDGNATITALLRDDVLNETTETLVLYIASTVILPEPEPPAPGFPARPRRRPRRLAPTVVATRSRTRARARAIATSGPPRAKPAIAVVSYAQRVVAELAQLARAGVTQSELRHVDVPVAHVSSRTVSRVTVRRRDGGDLEALTALGLI
jgi:hypothetical protein